MRWIDAAYTGKARLWRVFWLGYALPFLPLTAAIGAVKGAKLPAAAVFTLLVILLLYQAWAAVSLWRCAPNTSRPAYRRLGRVLAVVVGLMTLAAALQSLQ